MLAAFVLFCCAVLNSYCLNNAPRVITKNLYLSKKDLQSIGNKIWYNESKNSTQHLTWWVEGELCASLGIGHFIWYPKTITDSFTQTFPAVLKFLADNGISLPTWLSKESDFAFCPWQTREEFFKDLNSKQMIELRALLAKTVDLQTKFIIDRAFQALAHILANIPAKEHAHIKKHFDRIISIPQGLYAIIDYINFKGEGTNIKERYNFQGWGLLQVLELMHGNEIGKKAIEEFAVKARQVLINRVANAPKKLHEERFLAGWNKRIDTYLTEFSHTY